MNRAIPIAIICCQRPHYLQKTLLGLAESCNNSENSFNVRLFQDMPSGDREESIGITSQCAQYFHQSFPNGSIDIADKNIGIAANFKRAEAWAFSDLDGSSKYDAAFFFEEDFVPNESTIPWLIAMLNSENKDSNRIGAVSAAGHIQSCRENILTPMGQLWAYGIKKYAYKKISNKIEEYDRLAIEAFEQHGLHHPAQDICLGLAVKWGYEPQASSRDSFLTMALHSEGFLQIAPNGVHGEYIGVTGVNTCEEQFNASEWRKHANDFSIPIQEAIKKELPRLAPTIKDHQEKQFRTLDPTFYSDACAIAYEQRRYANCLKIAERGLELLGTQTCRGYPFCFERHRIKGLVGIKAIDDAINYCNEMAKKNSGSWPFWALARSLEDTKRIDLADRTWQFIIQTYKDKNGAATNAYKRFIERIQTAVDPHK